MAKSWLLIEMVDVVSLRGMNVSGSVGEIADVYESTRHVNGKRWLTD